MSNLTSILGTDLISASRSVINDNYQALNTSKAELASPAFTGVPTAPTASVGTSTTQVATTAFVSNAVPLVKSLVTHNPLGGTIVGEAKQISSSIIGSTSFFNLPAGIVVNAISLPINSVLIPGSFRVGVYTEDGQTQKINTVFASVAANTFLRTNNLSSVQLSAGNYYHVITALDGRAEFNGEGSNFEVLNSSVTGKQIYIGNQAITGGNLPATFNPNNLTSDAYRTISLRFDN